MEAVASMIPAAALQVMRGQPVRPYRAKYSLATGRYLRKEAIQIRQSSSAGISNVIISNFYNYFTQPVQAVINKDTITIPNQEMEGKVIFGVGFMNPTTTGIADQALTLRYEVIDTATGTVNDFGYYPADGSNASSWNK